MAFGFGFQLYLLRLSGATRIVTATVTVTVTVSATIITKTIITCSSVFPPLTLQGTRNPDGTLTALPGALVLFHWARTDLDQLLCIRSV